ncbi:MAG: lysine biosynthesis protein LysW [Chloroflexi bacterium RBG_19FT_COMBO_62_14]|nr:MAG: lysine biosynthesis protein LysW [Chloroflexi bacterium RBG_19FT_COMBO_62_14]
MVEAICVECGATIPLSAGLVLGEILPCPECAVELEVTSINPVQVSLAPEVEEDWGE